ncbi:hypothetical protein ABEB36_001811 [Hypothenemus hampei]|uniref:Zinc carboxypeptidase A 1 n=1 Tax=Hypothenemus hampei TaxID=57062 RepID=A0ABD1FIZ4_HYPHA
MKLLVLLTLSVLVTAKVSYRNYKLYKIIPKDEQALQFLKNLEDSSTELLRYQFWNEVTEVGNEVSLMVAPDTQNLIEAALNESNVAQSVIMNDVQEVIDQENPKWRSGEANPVDWTVYNTLEEINNWLEQMVQEFPNQLEILRPGKTGQGRDIVGVKLDFSPNVRKKTIFVESNIHAREWITSATTTYILDQFFRITDVEQRNIIEAYTWYFFPVMNPDGFVYSHETNRMWRKTRTRYNIFCYGADPNRNWGYQWMNGGASQNPCSDIYAGPEPFSEPSVRVMKEFIETIAEDMVAYLDFHSFSQMLLLPFGHTIDHLNNYDEMKEIGRIAMDELEEVYGTDYVVGNVAETIYIAAGSSMDWVKGEFNTSIAVTYELRDKGSYGFLLPADQILPTAEETLVSVFSILREYRIRHPEDGDESTTSNVNLI